MAGRRIYDEYGKPIGWIEDDSPGDFFGQAALAVIGLVLWAILVLLQGLWRMLGFVYDSCLIPLGNWAQQTCSDLSRGGEKFGAVMIWLGIAGIVLILLAPLVAVIRKR